MSGLAKAAGVPSSNMVLQLGSLASPPVYTSVANLGDFTGPTMTRTVVDTSKHGDNWERAVSTLKKGGEIAGPVWFDAENPTHVDASDGLEGLFESGDLRAWRIMIFAASGDEKHVFFDAYVTALSKKVPVKGVLSADLKLTIDGAVTRDY